MASLTVIDKFGDVIFVLQGDDEPRTVKLLVSSRVLSLASPVFRTMFDGRFAEGQNLSSTAPKEIPLPDDDADLMTKLCLTVHMQNSNLPTKIDIDMLANFAVLCEKYRCVDPVRFVGKCWVLEWIDYPMAPKFEKLLFVTYLLDLPDEFRKVTRSLIIHHTFQIDLGSATHGHDFLPIQIFSRLQAEGVLNYNKVATLIHAKQSSVYASPIYCNSARHNPNRWTMALRGGRLWPPSTTSIQICRSRLALISRIDWAPCVGTCLWCKQLVNPNAIVKDMDKEIASIQGLCLDCIKQDISGSKARVCRIPHPKLN